MLQKVQLLATIVHEPDLLILDEPFSGLDPVSARQLRELIVEEHRRGATILFSTHVMPHAEDMCEHVVMIHRGRKVLDEPLGAIRRQFDPRSILFEPFDPGADVESLRRYPDVERIERTPGGYYEIILSPGSDPGGAIQRIAAAIAPARIELSRPRLEDVFLRLVGGSGETTATVRDELRGEVA
jgi:ABC-2 type transport system ATP-binding protein